jgi:nucleotide-binding universal stress UspA family protein
MVAASWIIDRSRPAARLFPHRELVLVGVDDGATEAPAPGGREMTSVHIGKGHGESAHAVAEALAGYARRRQTALLVVESRGRSAVQEILLGSGAGGPASCSPPDHGGAPNRTAARQVRTRVRAAVAR